MVKLSEPQKLSKEEIIRIKRSSSAKKMRLRTVQGFKSLRQNPAKLIAALLYLAAVVYIFFQIEPLLANLIAPDNALFDLTIKVFKIAVIIIGLVFFLLLMMLLGTNIMWAQKLENAFISAGIYTKAWKAPFLINSYKDKESPLLIFEVYLNGNTKTDFESKQEEIESEIERSITDFKAKGTSRILLYSSPENAKQNKKSNRNDLNF